MKKLLLVEDEIEIAKLLKELMKDYTIVHVETVKDALLQISESFDCILLDVMLPDGNGFELCRQLRKTIDTPILFLTCKDDEDDIIEGLEAGGDDYVTKPFSSKVLKARIASLLRRTIKQDGIYYAGDLIINTNEYAIYKNNEKLDCSKVVFELIVLLIQAHGVVVTRDYLLDYLETVTGHIVENNTLSVHMKRIRTLLGTYQQQPYIETIRGVGYRWKIFE